MDSSIRRKRLLRGQAAFWLAVALLSVLPRPAVAQFSLSGQASSAFLRSDEGTSQYSVDYGRGTFAWRLDLFADEVIEDDIRVGGNLRLLQDGTPHVDYLAIKLTDLTPLGLSAQAGAVDVPFCDLAERRYPKQNDFYDLPLMNEHYTSLARSSYYLWVLDPSYAARGDGVRLLDGGLYDLGVRIDGEAGILHYAAALINGMVSASGSYQSNGLSSHQGFGKVGRLAITPIPELTVGVSFAIGPFRVARTGDSNATLYSDDPARYTQNIGGLDMTFGLGHFTMYGQAVYNRWEYDSVNLDAAAYSLEGRYAVTPRLSVAARAGGIRFNRISKTLFARVNGVPSIIRFDGRWDDDVVRWEFSAGYRLAREFLIRSVYQLTRTYSAYDESSGTVIAQVVATF